MDHQIHINEEESEEMISNQDINTYLLPEIVSTILALLPKSDLVTCTKINRIWEAEARTILLKRYPVKLHSENLADYMTLMKDRKLCHTSLDISFRFFLDTFLDVTLPLLTTFAERNASKVRHIYTDWAVNEGEVSNSCFRIWSHFINLTSIELRLFSTPDTPDSASMSNGLNPECVFPRVTTLILNIPKKDEAVANILSRGLAPSILATFPNISKLEFWNEWRSFFKISESGVLPLQNIGAMSFFTKTVPISMPELWASMIRRNLKPMLTPSVQLNLTQLEFNIITEVGISSVLADWSAILSKVASTLERLCIRNVGNTFPGNYYRARSHPFLLPILPKLKVLRIHRSLFLPSCDRIDCGFPNMSITFESHNQLIETNPKKYKRILLDLDYTQQFPTLTHFAVVKENDARFFKNFLRQKIQDWKEQDFFETSAPLLNSFLNVSDRPCSTLRYLDIPWPVEKRWKWVAVPGTSAWEWVPSSEFYDRVFKTFPNVENQNVRLEFCRKNLL